MKVKTRMKLANVLCNILVATITVPVCLMVILLSFTNPLFAAIAGYGTALVCGLLALVCIVTNWHLGDPWNAD